MSRNIAIGDIHGCAVALKALLDEIKPTADDRIICLGDLIDRGDDSKAVLDTLIELREQCNVVVIMGNHEEMLLQVVDGKNAVARLDQAWRRTDVGFLRVQW